MIAFSDPEEGLVPLGDLLGALDGHVMDESAMDAARDLLKSGKRSRPHALDAERAILGGVMFDNAVLADITAAGVGVGDFYRPSHGIIFGAMLALYERGIPIDSLTVVDELERRHSTSGDKTLTQLDDVGGGGAVAGLELNLPSSAFVPAYAQLVKEKASARALTVVAEELAQLAYAGAIAPHEAAERINLRLERIRADRPRLSEFETLMDRARTALAKEGLGPKSDTYGEPAFKPASELLGMQMPKVSWLVKGLLTEASVAMIGGEPKAFKTWAGLEVLLAVATGTEAFGEFKTTARRDVAAFLTEDDTASFMNRIFSLARGRDMPLDLALSHIHYKCLGALDLRGVDGAAYLIASMWALPRMPAVIMIDPFRNVIGDGEEDKAHVIAPIMQTCRAIRNVTGTTLLIVHHAVKATKDSKGRRGGQNLRGSSAIHGALDCGLYLSETDGDGKTLWQNKVSTETKRARGAGNFGLELIVEDMDDVAHVAQWRFHRELSTMVPAKGQNLGVGASSPAHALVREMLRGEARADRSIGRIPRPWSAVELSDRLELNARTVQRALGDLCEKQMVSKGARGWSYVETSADRDMEDDD